MSRHAFIARRADALLVALAIAAAGSPAEAAAICKIGFPPKSAPAPKPAKSVSPRVVAVSAYADATRAFPAAVGDYVSGFLAEEPSRVTAGRSELMANLDAQQAALTALAKTSTGQDIALMQWVISSIAVLKANMPIGGDPRLLKTFFDYFLHVMDREILVDQRLGIHRHWPTSGAAKQR